ncbi:TIGR02186 family protein [Hyphobacterium sp. HN65]|uniref:TIGR02186 family protein n=1 Tax=Hyphobacterium lacteum TaxID=3116575 RepID=A0ABU7LNC2_9PROT|nr:TIGR02186 family protein [Hyphobacterium sp. HN65]MEE2525409.1 TIGR02186 family protein [Hyphobacterium sp. HN65]
MIAELAAAALMLQGQADPVTGADNAPRVVAALSQEVVEIRSDFAGAEIILFGAVTGMEEDDDLVVVVRGPAHDLRVMRKERTFGIWINRAPVRFENVPSYYSVASTRPLQEVGAFSALRREGIGLQHLRLVAPDTEHTEVRLGVEVTVSEIGEEAAEYRDAISRDRRRDRLFAETTSGVTMLEGGLFRANVALPPATPVGDYTADVYLFRDGRPVASGTVELGVRKAGLERIIYNFAHDYAWLYGLVAIALALLFGWGAAAIFSRR